MNWLRRLFTRAPRSLVFIRQWRPLTPEEMAAAFRDWPDTDPRWRALWDLLALELEGELAAKASPKADPYEVMQADGRVQVLLHLRAQLLNLRQAGR